MIFLPSPFVVTLFLLIISVSQYVNGYRVQAACELLEAGDEPISAVMFEGGFLTKSNFNREFLRVTGKSPSAWRNSRRR